MNRSTETHQATAQVLPADLQHLRPLVIGDLIRVGDKLDGGYVVPKSAIMAADALLSFGLGANWSFEVDVAGLNPDLDIHVYDHSVTERNFIEMLVSAWKDFYHAQQPADDINKLVALYDAYSSFFQGKRVHIQERLSDKLENANDTTVDKAIARLNGGSRLLLKMDIEGDEYGVIDALLAHHSRIHLLIVEFHSTDSLRNEFHATIERICRYYEIAHIHGNNWDGVAPDGLPLTLEMTFLHKSRCAAAARRTRLPVAGLDFPNNPTRADHELVFA